MDEYFASNRLSAFLDGELSDSEMAEVAQALEQSPELQAEYEQLQAAVEFMRTHGPVDAPPRLHAKVMTEISASRSRSWLAWLTRGRFTAQGIGLAAVAAAVLFVVLTDPPADREIVEEEERTSAAQVEPSPEDLLAPRDQKSDTPAQEAEEAGDEKADPPEDLAALIKSSPQASTEGKEEAAASSGGAKVSKRHLPERIGTYIPDWDQPSEQPAAEIEDLSPADASFSYRLTPHDPSVLRALVALAESKGGEVQDVHGAPFQPYVLTVERNYQKIVMVLPIAELDSIEPALRNYGGVVPNVVSEKLFATDMVKIVVEVSYKP